MVPLGHQWCLNLTSCFDLMTDENMEKVESTNEGAVDLQTYLSATGREADELIWKWTRT